MIVPRFTFFTLNFVICINQITGIFRSGHDYVNAFSKRNPCYFGLQVYFTIRILRKVRKYTVLTRTRFNVLHWKVHETKWKCLHSSASRFPRSSSEVLSSITLSLNSCSQSSNSCDISFCTFFDSSFIILVSVFCGFMQGVSPKLFIRTATFF